MKEIPGRADRRAAAERRPFLLEIGSEEIPARFIPPSLAELAQRAGDLLSELHLEHGALRTMATPRRLALLVDDLTVQQPDRRIVVKGPPVHVAFDADGKPTAAAMGFARKNGVELDACQRTGDGDRQYLTACKVVAGRSTSDVLTEQLPELILSLPYPKVMRWGPGAVEYPRPLRWLVALLGDEVVPLQLADLVAGRATRGHRTLFGDDEVTLTEPTQYVARLRSVGVVVDGDERREIICSAMDARLHEMDVAVAVHQDPELLTEVVYLCEQPTVFAGHYEEEFFELPREVIVTALKAHQRYFAVDEQSGDKLLPRFLAVRDGGTDHLARVIAGNERVLRARLADALFYWRFDQRRTPDEHAGALAAVTWLEGFGSVADKTERLARLVPQLWRGGLGDGHSVPAAALRAARLAKSDLVSEMIKDGKEFTKLQGVIGARYAARAGEDPAVCRAIERHYYPSAAGAELPGDRISSVLSVADRLDSVAGCWLAGFAPTGAKDPYGLRRAALAILRIIIDLDARVDLDALIEVALAGFADSSETRDLAAARLQLNEFMQRRLAGYLAENLGLDPQLLRAVLPAHGNDPTDVVAWAEALASYRNQEDFKLLATGFKRCRNILEGQVLAPDQRDASLQRWAGGGAGADGESFAELNEPAEVELRQQVAAATEALLAAERSGQYDEVFRILSGFGPAIDEFFDTVRVNVADRELRQNRHAFLREIQALFVRYADFTAVAPADD